MERSWQRVLNAALHAEKREDLSRLEVAERVSASSKRGRGKRR